MLKSKLVSVLVTIFCLLTFFISDVESYRVDTYSLPDDFPKTNDLKRLTPIADELHTRIVEFDAKRLRLSVEKYIDQKAYMREAESFNTVYDYVYLFYLQYYKLNPVPYERNLPSHGFFYYLANLTQVESSDPFYLGSSDDVYNMLTANFDQTMHGGWNGNDMPGMDHNMGGMNGGSMGGMSGGMMRMSNNDFKCMNRYIPLWIFGGSGSGVTDHSQHVMSIAPDADSKGEVSANNASSYANQHQVLSRLSLFSTTETKPNAITLQRFLRVVDAFSGAPISNAHIQICVTNSNPNTAISTPLLQPCAAADELKANTYLLPATPSLLSPSLSLSAFVSPSYGPVNIYPTLSQNAHVLVGGVIFVLLYSYCAVLVHATFAKGLKLQFNSYKIGLVISVIAAISQILQGLYLAFWLLFLLTPESPTLAWKYVFGDAMETQHIAIAVTLLVSGSLDLIVALFTSILYHPSSLSSLSKTSSDEVSPPSEYDFLSRVFSTQRLHSLQRFAARHKKGIYFILPAVTMVMYICMGANFYFHPQHSDENNSNHQQIGICLVIGGICCFLSRISSDIAISTSISSVSTTSTSSDGQDDGQDDEGESYTLSGLSLSEEETPQSDYLMYNTLRTLFHRRISSTSDTANPDNSSFSRDNTDVIRICGNHLSLRRIMKVVMGLASVGAFLAFFWTAYILTFFLEPPEPVHSQHYYLCFNEYYVGVGTFWIAAILVGIVAFYFYKSVRSFNRTNRRSGRNLSMTSY